MASYTYVRRRVTVMGGPAAVLLHTDEDGRVHCEADRHNPADSPSWLWGARGSGDTDDGAIRAWVASCHRLDDEQYE